MLSTEEKMTVNAMVQAHYPVDLPDPVITLNLTIDDIKHFNGMANMKPALVLQVMGYLTTYAVVGGFKSALIYRDRNDIMAVYTRHNDSKFVMCAVWQEFEQKWGTHS